MQTAYAESAPFNVTPRAPVPMISSPVDGFHADWGQLIAFEAEIQDLQDESIADADIVWENDYRVLGTGRMLQTDTLEVGTNLVTVTATNSLGASGSASITVVIGDPLTPLDRRCPSLRKPSPGTSPTTRPQRKSPSWRSRMPVTQASIST